MNYILRVLQVERKREKKKEKIKEKVEKMRDERSER